MQAWTDDKYQDEFIRAVEPEESPSAGKLSMWYVNHPEKAWGTIEGGYGTQWKEVSGVRPYQKQGPTGKPIRDDGRYEDAMRAALTDNVRYEARPTEAAPVKEEHEARTVFGETPEGMARGTVVWNQERKAFGFAGPGGAIYEATEIPTSGKTADRIRRGLRLVELADSLFDALRANDIEEANKIRKTLLPFLQEYQKAYSTPKKNPTGSPSTDHILWRFLGGGPASSPFPFSDPRIWRLAALTDERGKPTEIFTQNNIYLPTPAPRSFDPRSLSDTAKFVYETAGWLDWAKVVELYEGGEARTADLVGSMDFAVTGIDADGYATLDVAAEHYYGDIWPKIDQTDQTRQLVTESYPPGAAKDRLLDALDDQRVRLLNALPEQADELEVGVARLTLTDDAGEIDAENPVLGPEAGEQANQERAASKHAVAVADA